MNYIKRYTFPIFFLVNLFAGEIFACYMSIKGISVESGMLQKLFAAIGAVSYIILIRDFLTGRNIKGYLRVITILVCILSMLMITSVFYTHVPNQYTAAVLYFGCICVASAISGCHLATYPYPNFNLIDKILPFFILSIGLTICTFGYMSALTNGLVKTETGLDYQNVSYICAEIVGYGGYYLLFSTARMSKSYKCLKIPIILTCLICAIVCLISGGRGGTILLLVYLFFFLNKLLQFKKISFIKIFIISGTIIVTFLIVANYLNIWESAGFNRVFSTINVDDARAELRHKSLQIFYDTNCLGGGLGSIWMNLGIYSHNIFLDLLAEIGIIGCIVVSLVIYKIFKALTMLSKEIIGCMLLLLIFLKGFILCLFSGYWLNTYQLWFAVGFVFALPYFKKIKNGR